MSLKDMRMRGRERRQEQSEMDREMQKIERAAMKSFLTQDAEGLARPKPPAQSALPVNHAARLAELQARISSDQLARASAAAAGGSSLPPGWRAACNPDGKVYYVHDETAAMQWTAPGNEATADGGESSAAAASSSADGGAESSSAAHRGGWEIGYSEQGVPYYFSVSRGVTQWEPPPEWSEGAGEPMPTQLTHTAADAEAAVKAEGGDGGPPTSLPVAQLPEASDGAVVKAEEPEAGDGEVSGGEAVDTNTGLGEWSVVEEPSMPAGGWAYDQPRGEKRERPSWAVNRKEQEAEEEEDELEDIKMRFSVPDDMREALERQAAAEKAAAEAADAAAPPPVFAKRKAGAAKAAIRRKPSEP